MRLIECNRLKEFPFLLKAAVVIDERVRIGCFMSIVIEVNGELGDI